MYKRKMVLSAAFLAMLVFGIVMAVLGSVLPSVIAKFDISMVNAGSLFLLMSLGMLFGSLLFGPVVDRYGYKGLMVVCATLIFAGIEGIALAPSVTFLKGALILVGFAGGAINGGANALVADISGENRGSGLSFLGVFFGIGAFSVPFILGSLLGAFSYETLIATVGFLVLIPVTFFMVIRFPASKHHQGFPVADGLKLFKEKTLLLFGALLFIQSGLEMVISGWSATFFNDTLQIDARQSVFLLSAYWFALMIARIALGNFLKPDNQHVALYLSMGISLVGTLLMITSSGIITAVAGLVITGVGFAAAFPLILAFVGDSYSKLSGTAFSLVLAMGLLGGMLFPWLTGIMAEIFGLRMALLIAPISIVSAIILFRYIELRRKTSE
jgi:MFS transporter, FHS family, glucose/mannose:H+ symporter